MTPTSRRLSPPTRSRCSSTGPKRRAPACRSTRRPPRWWCRSAGGWTGCRWPSSWPPPGCGRCRWAAWPTAWTSGSGCSPGEAAPPWQRQQTLRATVEWSYSLLNGAEQLLLRRLSVFAESFDLDAAEAVCGFGDIEVFDVTGLLGSLVDKSLVVAEPAGGALRYRLLETIRQFAAERLAEAGDGEAAAAAAAHCAHYPVRRRDGGPAPDRARPGQMARPAGRRPGEPAARRRACGRPPGRDRAGAALRRRAAALLDGARSANEEALALLLPVLDRPEARADPELFGTALVTAAVAARFVDIAAARQLGEQAVTLARQLGADRLLIESLAALSSVCYFAGEPERGLPPGREAVERARQLGDDVLLGESLTEYLLCSDVIDPAHARPLFAEAIACTQRSGDHLVSPLLAQQRRRSRPARRGHPRRPGSPATGGTSHAGDRA